MVKCVVIVLLLAYLKTHQCNYKSALARALCSLASLFLLFLYKYLHCKKLEGNTSLEYSEVLSPLFVHLQFVMIRACHLH